MAKTGLYANIHAKQERIERQKAAGKTPERMRTPGSKGAPTAAASGCAWGADFFRKLNMGVKVSGLADRRTVSR